ncbi:hypothetical protein BH09BAC2_BH09BAC2_22780 [soil metagenome]
MNKYYVGQTQNIEERIYRHNNSSGSKFTKVANDWKLMYSEEYLDRSAAYIREMEIKRKKSKRYIEYLISLDKKL